MNLPLLFWAAQETGEERYRNAALQHARQSQRHLVRPDGGTYHTVYVDAETGAFRFPKTAQGHTDSSLWARGQGWAVYGFALAYRYTREEDFLHTACLVADTFLEHLPEDGVPYWDFDFTDGSGEPRDSSAGAIAVCGLLELVRWLPEGETRARYEGAAHDILASLITNYTPRDADGSNALLLHGVQNLNRNRGVDEANLWGDYFYLEALTRLARDWEPYW